MTDVVRLSAVTKRYEAAGPAALDAVSIHIAQGEAVAVMGPSGSGKSTLLNLIAGLDRPTSGTVTVAGVDLAGLSETGLARFRRTQLGLIFQFFHLLEDMTVLDNVLLPARLGAGSTSAARRRAGELLDLLGIGEKADAYPARLSGGQRQRVAIARALINRPPLLLADEPTGALDTANGNQILDLLTELNRQGQTLVLITHDATLAQRCTSRSIRLIDGRVASDGTTATVAGARTGAHR